MRVTFVISSLASGGAERVISHMANYWVRKGWYVTLITLSDTNTDFFELDSRINRKALQVTGSSHTVISAAINNLRRIEYLRISIISSRPDVIISFIDKTNIITLIATLFTTIPVIVAEHTDPRRHQIGLIWKLLRRMVYPKVAALIVLTPNVLDWAKRMAGAKKIHVIPNSITPGISDKNQNLQYKKPYIISVGKLENVKGFDLLLDAFSRVSGVFPDWNLVILGEGSQRNRLEEQIRHYGMVGRVLLPGLHHNPMSVMQHAEFYVMSSRYEGFPIVLLEALASSLPVISFDCESGPRDIIRHSIDGLLVRQGDIEELSNTMHLLMSDAAMRTSLAGRGREVLERFGENKIMAVWESLINSILQPDVKRRYMNIRS